MRQAAKGRPRAAEVVGPCGRTGRFPHLVGAGALTRPPQRIPPLVGAAISRPSQTASYLRSGRSGTGPCGGHRTGFCIFVGAAHRAARKRPDGGIGPYKKIKRTSGYAVGAGPRPARRFWTYAGAHSVRPRAAEVVGPYGRTGRFPHLAGAGALTRPPQRSPPTRRGGTLGRPETARWGHRALQKIKRTFGSAVGAGARPRPPQRIPPLVGAAHRAARKRPDGDIGPYKRSNAPPDTP